jgi:hypothetical protein
MKTIPITHQIRGAIVAACLIASAFRAFLILPIYAEESVQVLDRGPNHRVVQINRQFTNDVGEVTIRTNRYTELEAGLRTEVPTQSSSTPTSTRWEPST